MSISIAQLLLLLQLSWAVLIYGKTIDVNPMGNDSQDCLTGQIPCSSLEYALNHSQNDDCVNITSNLVLLSTTVQLNNIDSVITR